MWGLQSGTVLILLFLDNKYKTHKHMFDYKHKIHLDEEAAKFHALVSPD